MTRADARAVVFPMHEPDGYPGPNDVAIAAAAASDGRLVSFCRLDPRDHPGGGGAPLPGRGRGRASSCTRAPSSSRWHEPGVREIVAVAHERRVPDPDPRGPRDSRAGRRTRCELSTEFPDARLILAHAAISDLAWLWHVLPDHPNVFIDTAWWNPADHIALFSLVDAVADRVGVGLARTACRCSPRGRTRAARCRRAWRDEALRSIMGGQIARLVAGEDPLWVGDAPGAVEAGAAPAAGPRRHAPDLGDGPRVRRRRPDESLDLARLSCAVGEDAPHADVCAATEVLLDLFREHLARRRPGARSRSRPASSSRR